MVNGLSARRTLAYVSRSRDFRRLSCQRRPFFRHWFWCWRRRSPLAARATAKRRERKRRRQGLVPVPAEGRRVVRVPEGQQEARRRTPAVPAALSAVRRGARILLTLPKSAKPARTRRFFRSSSSRPTGPAPIAAATSH